MCEHKERSYRKFDGRFPRVPALNHLLSHRMIRKNRMSRNLVRMVRSIAILLIINSLIQHTLAFQGTLLRVALVVNGNNNHPHNHGLSSSPTTLVNEIDTAITKRNNIEIVSAENVVNTTMNGVSKKPSGLFRSSAVISNEQPKKASIQYQTRMDRARRSLMATYACVGTWMLIHYGGLSPIQASSVQGMAVSLIITQPPFVGAAFCGTFAGMSGQVTSLFDTILLGISCGLTYYGFESGSKMGVGYGGRLGTIAFLSNVLYMLVRNPFGFVSVVRNTLTAIEPHVLVLAVASLLISKYRKIVSKIVDDATSKESWKEKPGLNSLPNLRLIPNVMKIILVGALSGSVVWNTKTSMLSLAKTSIAVFAASITSKKSPGFVLPVAALGMLASFLLPTFAAPVYLGAFIGMTAIPTYKEANFLQASVISASLFHLGLLDGFGGKLGFLAFLGVNLGL